jgi:hypothetical protein
VVAGVNLFSKDKELFWVRFPKRCFCFFCHLSLFSRLCLFFCRLCLVCVSVSLSLALSVSVSVSVSLSVSVFCTHTFLYIYTHTHTHTHTHPHTHTYPPTHTHTHTHTHTQCGGARAVDGHGGGPKAPTLRLQ